jgi:hypothetical protein
VRIFVIFALISGKLSMKHINLFRLVLLAALAVSAGLAHSEGSGDNSPRSRGYGFLMLEEPVNPRNVAMGSAGAALGGAGFRYYNPVLPFFSASSYVTGEIGQLPDGVSKGGFEIAVVSPEWFSGMSFQTNSVDYQTSDEHGPGTTALSGTTFGALTSGHIIRDNFALGIGINIAEDRIWVASRYMAVALSVGAGYKLIDGRLNLGAAWLNGLAWSRGYGDNPFEWHSGQVPMFVRGGAVWADRIKSLPYTIAADVVYSDEDGTFTAPVGVEVKVLPYVNLRAGKRIGWENEIMSFGIGFNMDKISFDAAFVPTVFVSDYGIKWSMGFGYALGKKGKIKALEPIIQPAVKPAEEPQESPQEEEPQIPEPTELPKVEEPLSETEEEPPVTDDLTDDEPSTEETESLESTTDTPKDEEPLLEVEGESSSIGEESSTETIKSPDTKDESINISEESAAEETDSTSPKNSRELTE